MSAVDRKGTDNAGLLWLGGIFVGLLFGIPCGVWVIVHLSQTIAPGDGSPKGMWGPLFGLFSGQTRWGISEWVSLVLIGAVVGGLIWMYRKLAKPSGPGKKLEIDRAAKFMATVDDMESFTEPHLRKSAEWLGTKCDAVGIYVGNMVRHAATKIYASFEDTMLVIMGPRAGKTTSQAAPILIEAPGAVVATSNKRDLHDLTVASRRKTGDVWVFDPMTIVGAEPTWWWNPLTFVTDTERAMEMAENFALGSRQEGAKTDGFFEPAGKELLAALLLAAALDQRPIKDVYYWLQHTDEDRAADILRAAGYSEEADTIIQNVNAPERQKAGVYSTASTMAACLKNKKVQPWINPTGDDDNRPQLRPEELVRGNNTLYALSREGAGTTGPLVTCLTVAVTTAAEEYATQQPGGRLAMPMTLVLDEAANICRWGNLPNLYSHYGSRGIIPVTFLQSYAQGVEVWGNEGMKKLYSSATLVLVGPRVRDDEFHDKVRKTIGTYRYRSTSHSRSRDGRSSSTQDATDDILDIKDLSEMKKGRAVLLAEGAVLLETVPISRRDYAEEAATSKKHEERLAAQRLNPSEENGGAETRLERTDEDLRPQTSEHDQGSGIHKWISTSA